MTDFQRIYQERAADYHRLIAAVDLALRSWLEAEKTTFAGASPQTTLPETGAPSRLLAELVERAHGEGHLTDAEARCMLKLDVLAPLPWDQVEP